MMVLELVQVSKTKAYRAGIWSGLSGFRTYSCNSCRQVGSLYWDILLDSGPFTFSDPPRASENDLTYSSFSNLACILKYHIYMEKVTAPKQAV